MCPCNSSTPHPPTPPPLKGLATSEEYLINSLEENYGAPDKKPCSYLRPSPTIFRFRSDLIVVEDWMYVTDLGVIIVKNKVE